MTNLLGTSVVYYPVSNSITNPSQVYELVSYRFHVAMLFNQIGMARVVVTVLSIEKSPHLQLRKP
jgi:hypothetical protein